MMKFPHIKYFGWLLLCTIGLSIAIALAIELATDFSLLSIPLKASTTPSFETRAVLFFTIGVGLWISLMAYTKHTWRIQRERVLVLLISTSTFLFLYLLINFMRMLGLNAYALSTLSGISCGIIFMGVISIIILGRHPMDELHIQREGVDAQLSPQVSDFIALTKPVIIIVLLITTLAAMIIATGSMPRASLLFWTMLGGALTAGGSSALNQYIDRDADQKMYRTRRRPLAEGRLRDVHAISFGITLCILGFYVLAIFVNLLAALLALAGIIYYVIFYSLFLKYSTTQNIVIGGGAGAIPPLVGWAAVTASLSIPAFFLFALVFFWTPPHFWALALLKKRDYARADVPMLPVVYGNTVTRGQIFLYSIQLVALTLLLPLANLGSWLFLIAAIALGAGLLTYAWRLLRSGGKAMAWRMYRYSSMYLALIFAALVVDTLVVG